MAGGIQIFLTVGASSFGGGEFEFAESDFFV